MVAEIFPDSAGGKVTPLSLSPPYGISKSLRRFVVTLSHKQPPFARTLPWHLPTPPGLGPRSMSATNSATIALRAVLQVFNTVCLPNGCRLS